MSDLINSKKEIYIRYKNWRGETGIRKIVPEKVVFESTEWHTEEQWLLYALDVEKSAQRGFAIKDIEIWSETPIEE